MKYRPILVATIGYIIGILWGLYFNFSIAPFCIILIATVYLLKIFFKNQNKRKFKLLSVTRYLRYLKLYLNSKAIIILIIFSIISNSIILNENKQYQNFYEDEKEINFVGFVVSSKQESNYYNLYKVKVENFKNKYLYIQIDKKQNDLGYADKVKITGIFKKPKSSTNYGGYNDENYLKTLKIYGRVKVQKFDVIEKNQLNIVSRIANKTCEKIKDHIDNSFDEKKAGILKGLLLGDTNSIRG